jgi:hypothetical protein
MQQQDPFANQVIQWLQIAEVSYILTPILLFIILLCVLVLIGKLNKMIALQEQYIISRLPNRARERQIV